MSTTTNEKPKATQVTLGKHKHPNGETYEITRGDGSTVDSQNALVRFSYLHVERPHLNTENKLHEYSLQILIPKENVDDYAAAKAAVDEQTKLFFPKGRLPPRFHNPIRDGDTGVNQKGEPINRPGFWVIGAKTAAFERSKDGKSEDQSKPLPAPGLVGIDRDENNKLLPTKAKSGDWGRVSVNFKGYTTGDGGVGVYLNNLQKVVDGQSLGGGRKEAADEFADFDDENDPLA